MPAEERVVADTMMIIRGISASDLAEFKAMIVEDKEKAMSLRINESFETKSEYESVID